MRVLHSIVALCVLLALCLLPSLLNAFPGANGAITFSLGNSTYVVQPDGSGFRDLSPDAVHLRWSPDGSKVIYRLPNFTLHIGEVDGLEIVSSRPLGVSGGAPAFSPNGLQVVYFGFDGLYVLSVNGGEPRFLTREGQFHDWAPDGSVIALHRTFTRVDQVAAAPDHWTIQPDGSMLGRITQPDITWPYGGPCEPGTCDLPQVCNSGECWTACLFGVPADARCPGGFVCGSPFACVPRRLSTGWGRVSMDSRFVYLSATSNDS